MWFDQRKHLTVLELGTFCYKKRRRTDTLSSRTTGGHQWRHFWAAKLIIPVLMSHGNKARTKQHEKRSSKPSSDPVKSSGEEDSRTGTPPLFQQF